MISTDRKILGWDEARGVAIDLGRSGRRIVFTNGCFDLLHLGHLRYLTAAGNLGDFLMVGLNSDRSVKTIKGPRRPINPQEHRAEVLAGLEVVGGVIIFDEPDPYNLIDLIQPDVLVKGGDWPVEQIIGRDIVIKKGGRVLNIPLTEGVSTTGIIKRILETHRPRE